MKDIRDMRRSDWHRITERRYTACSCQFKDMDGVVSLIEMQKVERPIIVSHELGETVIADNGYSWLQLAFKEQYFWATAMFNADGNFIEIYFDITGGNTFEDMNNPKFSDMYLDIVLLNDGSIHILDREELDEALAKKEISQEEYLKAIAECDKLYNFLSREKEEVVQFCVDWRERIRKAPTE